MAFPVGPTQRRLKTVKSHDVDTHLYLYLLQHDDQSDRGGAARGESGRQGSGLPGGFRFCQFTASKMGVLAGYHSGRDTS